MNFAEIRQKFYLYNIYNLTILFLAILAGWFVYSSGFSVFQQIIVVTLIATVLDEAIYYFKNKKTFIPKSAIITGLIIALLILSEPLWVQIALPVVAIALKHLLKYKGKEIFNPAALALIIGAILFKANIAWAGVSSLIVLFGFVLAYRLRRLNATLAFILSYYAVNLLLSTHHLPKIYLPDAVTIFFATIMLVEPKTSPQSKYGMIVFSIFAAVLANLFSHFGSLIDPLLAALLISNISTRWLNKIQINNKLYKR